MLSDSPVGIEDVSRSAGAPAEQEIEITPEMIGHGVDVFFEETEVIWITKDGATCAVRRILKAVLGDLIAFAENSL